MKRIGLLLTLCLVALLCMAAPTVAQGGSGMSVTCDNGVTFDNGVEIIVNQMREGFTYTATAIGLNGFDPVLAALDSNRRGLCNDDNANAAAYSANLPSTGLVAPSPVASQINFSQTSGQNMADVSLVVGGLGNTSGEFLLILEGMAVTDADGAGDAFSVHLTPGIISSGVPVTAYMISVTDQLDPLMFLGDENLHIVQDDSGADVYCDDGGDAELCWGESSSLSGMYISRTQGRQLGGFGLDSMLTLGTEGATPDLFYNLVMTSYQQSTFGDYLVAFHMGIGDASTDGSKDTQAEPTPVPQQPIVSGALGMSVTCDSGVTFDNGVEVIINQMRAGFTYTATAIGINGFDPVLAVLGANGRGLCNDDDANAAAYTANLPSTGLVPPSQLASQISFSQTSGQNMADVSLVVGGLGNTSGEFVLVLEGMAVTNADGAGDPFSVHITPGVIGSGLPVTAYMITVTDQLDPLMFLGDEDLNIVQDGSGADVYCDDGGDTQRCWGESSNLAGQYISRTQGRELGGFGFDAMLSLPTADVTPDLFFNFVMTSYQQATFGDYLVAFHMGIGDAGGSGGKPNA
jgi:hypothetical protein